MKYLMWIILIYIETYCGNISSMNITDQFYQSLSVDTRRAFFATINQSNLIKTFKLTIELPSDVNYILLIRNTSHLNLQGTEPTCYPLKVGKYWLDHNNGDVAYKEPFIQYSFTRGEGDLVCKLVSVKSTDRFMMTYYQHKTCTSTSSVVFILGIVAYLTMKSVTACPEEHPQKIILNKTCSSNNLETLCIDTYSDESQLAMLKSAGVLFLKDSNIDTGSKLANLTNKKSSMDNDKDYKLSTLICFLAGGFIGGLLAGLILSVCFKKLRHRSLPEIQNSQELDTLQS